MKTPTRRTDSEKVQVGAVGDGVKQYYDHNLEHTVVKLMTGDCFVAGDPRYMLVTILGSCISVCMRDPVAKVGGMNHILLPGNSSHKDVVKGDPEYCTRFGAFAMEELINGILKLGGQKDRLETKIFGGGNVIKNSAMIGSKNINFVKEYLKKEGLVIKSENVGGTIPRRIHYFPDTGKVMLRSLKRKDDLDIVEQEKKYEDKIVQKPKADDVELF